MKKTIFLIAFVSLLGLALAGCVPPPPTFTPTVSPTTLPSSPVPDKPKPTITPTLTNTVRSTLVRPTDVALSTAVAATTVPPTAAPVLPATFDIDLTLTTVTCGSGAEDHPYTFTIDGSALSLLQVDAGITTVGSYDSTTGAFATSATVGPGVEAYAGTITMSGSVITVVGTNTYTQAGQCAYSADVTGETTVP